MDSEVKARSLIGYAVGLVLINGAAVTLGAVAGGAPAAAITAAICGAVYCFAGSYSGRTSHPDAKETPRDAFSRTTRSLNSLHGPNGS